MTREVIGVLTTAGVRVLGHRAVAGYRGSSLSAAAIAKALDADAIVAGSVLQAGSTVEVAMELIDPATGENLWSATVARPAADVLTLQREVAGEIARGIEARLTPEQRRDLGSAPRVNPRAYAEYLLAQEQLVRWTGDGFRRSVEHLERALALDSAFAPAWGRLAQAHVMALLYVWEPAGRARALAERAAARALALDPRLGDAHVALGMARLYGAWDFPGAEAEFRRGAELNPSALALDMYGLYHWAAGDFAAAVAVIDRAIDIEPTTAQWHSDRGWFLWSAGDTAGMRRAARRAVELDPTFYEGHHQLAWLEKTARLLVAPGPRRLHPPRGRRQRRGQERAPRAGPRPPLRPAGRPDPCTGEHRLGVHPARAGGGDARCGRAADRQCDSGAVPVARGAAVPAAAGADESAGVARPTGGSGLRALSFPCR